MTYLFEKNKGKQFYKNEISKSFSIKERDLLYDEKRTKEKYKVKMEKEEALKTARTNVSDMDSISDLEKLKQEHDDKVLHNLVNDRIAVIKAAKVQEAVVSKQRKTVASVKASIDDLQKEVIDKMPPEQQQAFTGLANLAVPQASVNANAANRVILKIIIQVFKAKIINLVKWLKLKKIFNLNLYYLKNF